MFRGAGGTQAGDARPVGAAWQACAVGGIGFCGWVILASDASSLWLLLVLMALAVPAWLLGVAHSAPVDAPASAPPP